MNSSPTIAGFQLTQHKLAAMALEYGKGLLLAIHLGRAKDATTLAPHQVHLESILTYEGTREMHTLIIGQALTGHAAFA